MNLKKEHYELLDYLAQTNGGDKIKPLEGYDIDLIKSLEAERFIRTDAKRTEGQITGKGLVRYIQSKSKSADIEMTESFDAVLDEAIEPEEDSLSDFEKRAMENLSDKQIEVLVAASQSVSWIDDTFAHATRRSLVRYGFLAYDEEKKRVCLTQQGREKLASIAVPEGEHPQKAMPKVKPFVETAPDNGDSIDVTPIPQPLPHSDEEGEQDMLAHCDSCEGCVDKEILHMLMKKYPAIGKLRRTVLETRQLMDELGLK